METLTIGKNGSSLRSIVSLEFEQKRVVRLTGEITAELAERVIIELQYLDSRGSDEITLYINSPGGSVSAAFAIYDCLRHLKSPVKLVATGECMSMAAILLASGKQKRFATSNCEIMIHEPLTATSGSASHLKVQVDRITRMKTKIVALLSEWTNQDKEYLSHLLEKDTFMTSEEALEFGLIDGII